MTATTRAVDPMIQELEQEAEATRRMLERVPGDKLEWRPHAKSMTLGQLALHVATLSGGISHFLEIPGFEADDADFTPPQPATREEILDAFSASQADGKRRLEALDDEAAHSPWTLTKGGGEVFTVPKIAMARSLMFNHLYHHRGQLSVYLRLLDVPVPVTYGRSADENPFG